MLSRRLSLATVSAWECSFECPISLELCFKIITPLKLDSGALVVDIHLPPPLTLTLPTPVFVMLMCTEQACAKPAPPEKLLNNVL